MAINRMREAGGLGLGLLVLTLISLPSSPNAGRNGMIRLGPDIAVQNVADPFDYFTNSWGLIGLKDYPGATRVSPDGRFLLGDQRSFRLFLGDGRIPLNSRVKKMLLKDYLPVLLYDFIVNESIEFSVEAFSCPLDSSNPDGFEWPSGPNFLNLMKVTLHNHDDSPHSAVFGFEWEGVADFSVEDLSGQDEWALYDGHHFLSTMAGPPYSRVSAGDSLIKIEVDLSGGETQTAFLLAPFHSMEKREADKALRISRAEFENWRTRTVDFWEGLLQRGARLEIPEEKPQASYLASLVYQFIGRDHGDVRAGENFDDAHLHDGAYQTISLAQAGFLDEARESLELLPRFQEESGRFLSPDGRLDATGYGVWALVEFGLLSGDSEWLERLYPRIEKAVAYIRQARHTDKDPDSPFSGILPKAPAEGENLPEGRHIVGYDLWNLRGLQAAAAAAKLTGREGDAADFEREFENYRASIIRAVDRAGLPYIPPSYEKDGTHWGNLEVVFPTALINPHDRRFTGTLENVHDHFGRNEGTKAGFIEGVIQWAPETNAIHPLISLFVTNSYIIREEQDKAVDGFYSFLLHSTSTQGFPGGVYYRTREARENALPHLRAAALYVMTLRNMLVREDGENLHIFSAVPAEWLEPGQSISFENVPTRFGKISLTAKAEEDSITVFFTRPERRDPARLLIHLPPSLEITSVGSCDNRNKMKMSVGREVFIPGMNLKEENGLNICIQRKPKPVSPTFAKKVAAFLAGSN